MSRCEDCVRLLIKNKNSPQYQYQHPTPTKTSANFLWEPDLNLLVVAPRLRSDNNWSFLCIAAM